LSETLEMKDGKLRKIIEIPANDVVMCNTCKTFANTTSWDEVLEDGSVASYFVCNNCGKSPLGSIDEVPLIQKPKMPRVVGFECHKCPDKVRYCRVAILWNIKTKEDAIKMLVEWQCRTPEKMALIPIISPKVPSHSHYPYEKTHSISRKHRNNMIVIRKFVSLLEKKE